MPTENHWYDRNGDSKHRMLGKNGKMRSTTIRDAREKGLLPSVTTILGILDKPQLNDWKHKKITRAVWDGFQTAGCDEYDAFHARLMEVAFKEVDDAADRGTDLHRALELHFKGQPLPDEGLRTYVTAVDRWCQENKIEFLEHELRMACVSHGFAGTTDAVIRSPRGIGILDFKSRKSKPEYPMTPYDTQPMQIAAYHIAKFGTLPENDHIGVNVFISTTEPGRVEGTWYDAEAIRANWEAFHNALKLWIHLRGYDPRDWAGKLAQVS